MDSSVPADEVQSLMQKVADEYVCLQLSTLKSQTNDWMKQKWSAARWGAQGRSHWGQAARGDRTGLGGSLEESGIITFFVRYFHHKILARLLLHTK